MTTKVKHIANNVVTDSHINLSTIDSGEIAEGSNLYFTDARVDSRLSGGSVGAITHTQGYTQTAGTWQKQGTNGNITIASNGNELNFSRNAANYLNATGASASLNFLTNNQTALTLNSGQNAIFTGDVTIQGQLSITGNIDQYNVTDLDVTDKTITLGSGQTEANSGGSGIIVDGSAASILWDESTDLWDFNKGIEVLGNIHISAGGGQRYIELASGTSGAKTWRFYNGISWNPDALLIYDHTSDATALTIEPGKLGINRGANSLSQTLEVGGGAVIDGTLGIGVSPSSVIGLYVTKSLANGLAAEIGNTQSSTGSGIVVKGGNNSSTYSADFRNYNNVTLMRVRGDGHVGIGTNSPSSALTIRGQGSSGSQKNTIAFGTSGWGSPTGPSTALDGGVKLALFEGGTQKVQIGMDSNARLWLSSCGSGAQGVDIYTGSSNTNAPTLRVRVDQAGLTNLYGGLSTASANISGALTNSTFNRGLKFDSASVKPSNGSGGDADNHVDLGTSAARFKNLHLSGDISSGGSITSNDGSGTFSLSGDSNSNTYLVSTGEIRIRPSGTTVNKFIIGSNGNLTTQGTVTASSSSGTNAAYSLGWQNSARALEMRYDASYYMGIEMHAQTRDLIVKNVAGDSAGDVRIQTGTSATVKDRLVVYNSGNVELPIGVKVGDDEVYQDTGDNFYGGLVFETPIYKEYQYYWSGHLDHETNVYVPSYFMSEIVFTQHQTNGGTDINRHFVGKFANNHTHHELETIHDSGGTWSMTTTMTATDHNLNASGGGSSANGRLRIVETYGSGSYSKSTLTIRVYFGTISNITHSAT